MRERRRHQPGYFQPMTEAFSIGCMVVVVVVVVVVLFVVVASLRKKNKIIFRRRAENEKERKNVHCALYVLSSVADPGSGA